MNQFLAQAYAIGQKLAMDQAVDAMTPDVEQTPDKLLATAISKLDDRRVPDLSKTTNPNKDATRSSGFGKKIDLDPNMYASRLG
jgi:hypothetical protein